MRVLGFIMAASAILGMSSAAQAGTFKPAGQWAADYGDDYCLLGRVFTDGKEEITLAFERTQPGQFFRLVVIGDALKTFRTTTSLGYTLLPAGSERQGQIVRGKSQDGKQYMDLGLATVESFAMPAPGSPPVFKPYRTAEERAAAKAVTAVEFNKGLTESVRIETGSLDAPIGALQKCTSDLVKQWGIDPAAHETLTRNAFPAGPASAWVPTGTFPFSEFSKLSGGRNAFRVLVDATGKPTKCEVFRPSVAGTANQTACDGIMKNGKFTPALDAQGQPIASYWITEVFGLMPPMGGPRR